MPLQKHCHSSNGIGEVTFMKIVVVVYAGNSN